MPGETLRATYLIETAFPLERAAESIAGEQSSGTFVAVPGESDELRRNHRARVLSITPLGEVPGPTLPGARVPKSPSPPRYQQARIEIEWPVVNLGHNLPTLQATVMGNLYELGEFSGLKLLDLHLPHSFADTCPPPRFGVDGTRRLCGVHNRPIIGTIIKPSVGLTPRQTAELVRTLAEAGIDFVKDDELMADPPHCPLAERVKHVMAAINDVADRTGKKVMYAVNISDQLDNMLRHHDTVLAHGGTCVMVSVNCVGLSGVRKLADHTAVPIHGHRNGWGMLSRCPVLGVEFTAYQKLWRLAGVDQLHVNGLQNKFCESDDSVVRSIHACLSPLFPGGTDRIVPVISSGQWGGQAPETYRRTHTLDVMYLAGGGIMAHPDGPAAGLRAIRQCWEAAVAGVPLADYARRHPELQKQLEKFGRDRN
ncbi:MAG: ribulose-bisphosphate carboxylase large subunit family protein [Tepidisphaerales bacterium]